MQEMKSKLPQSIYHLESLLSPTVERLTQAGEMISKLQRLVANWLTPESLLAQHVQGET